MALCQPRAQLARIGDTLEPIECVPHAHLYPTSGPVLSNAKTSCQHQPIYPRPAAQPRLDRSVSLASTGLAHVPAPLLGQHGLIDGDLLDGNAPKELVYRGLFAVGKAQTFIRISDGSFAGTPREQQMELGQLGLLDPLCELLI